MISATILADSIGRDAPRLTSMELVYPRFIHADFMTHRVFSRNASSSRAIPVMKLIDAILADPAKPVEWRLDEPGMQGWTVADEIAGKQADALWNTGMINAVQVAHQMAKLGLHKQHINRIIEPFCHMRVVLTATDFDNFDGLRDHGDADPTIQALAKEMIAARAGSTPKLLQAGEWHLPYIEAGDDAMAAVWVATASEAAQRKYGARTPIDLLKRISAARCARVSYRTHDGMKTDFNKDLALFDRLVGTQPIHASPVEHQATPDTYQRDRKRWSTPARHGNLRGWCQFRKYLPHENLQQAA